MKSKLAPPNLNKLGQPRPMAHLVKLPEAAKITGLPLSLLRKAFMREEKRPRNVPAPPPHKRIGRAIYILADRLPAWVESLNDSSHAGRRKID
jgi:hypothetical protein